MLATDFAEAADAFRAHISTARQSPMVDEVVSHMCAFGMTSVDEMGTGLVYKPTRFLSC